MGTLEYQQKTLEIPNNLYYDRCMNDLVEGPMISCIIMYYH